MAQITADGRTTINWKGGKGIFAIQNNGGATVTLEFSADGGTTFTAFGSDTTFAAADGGGAFIWGAGDIYANTSSYSTAIDYVALPAEGQNIEG